MATILLGKDLLTGKDIEVEISAFASTHTHIMGRSGYGKTSLLKRITRDLVRADCGLLVLDGKNELADDVIDAAAYYKLGSRAIVIDPKSDWTVGLNYLEPIGNIQPDELAELTIEALKKFVHEEDEYKAWLEEWGPSSLLPLIEAKMTLLELFSFTSPLDAAFREAVLQKMKDPFFKKKWEELQTFRPPEQAQMLNVVRTRATKFWTNPVLKTLFGQDRTTIDWLRVMNEGGIVVARLGEGEGLTKGAASFIGAAILHQVKNIAPERGSGPHRPFFIVADEFQKFATSDFADGLDRLRSFGVHFILSHQHLAHLKKEESTLLESVVTNSANKIYFSISAKDALEIAEELFAGWIHGDELKDEIWQTKFRPVETTRLVVSHGRGHASGYADMTGHAIGSGWGSSAGTGGTLENPTYLDTSSESGSSVDTEAHVESETEITSETQTIVPWYEHEEFKELSGRTFRTPEELRERYKGFLVRQDPRHFQWKLHQAFPRAMVSPTIKPIPVSLFDKKDFWDMMLKRQGRPGIQLYAKKDDLLKEINQRVEAYIEAQNQLFNDQPPKSPFHKIPKAKVPKGAKGKNKKPDRT